MYRQKSPVMLRLLKADLCQGAITLLGLPDAALSNIVAFLPVEDVVRLSSANHSMQVRP